MALFRDSVLAQLPAKYRGTGYGIDPKYVYTDGSVDRRIINRFTGEIDERFIIKHDPTTISMHNRMYNRRNQKTDLEQLRQQRIMAKALQAYNPTIDTEAMQFSDRQKQDMELLKIRQEHQQKIASIPTFSDVAAVDNAIPDEDDFIKKFAEAQEDPKRFLANTINYSRHMYQAFLDPFVRKLNLEYHHEIRSSYADSIVTNKRSNSKQDFAPYVDMYEFVKLAPAHVVVKTLQNIDENIKYERQGTIPSEVEQEYIRTIGRLNREVHQGNMAIEKLEKSKESLVEFNKGEVQRIKSYADEQAKLLKASILKQEQKLKDYKDVNLQDLEGMKEELERLEAVEFDYTFLKNVDLMAYETSPIGKQTVTRRKQDKAEIHRLEEALKDALLIIHESSERNIRVRNEVEDLYQVNNEHKSRIRQLQVSQGTWFTMTVILAIFLIIIL